MQQFKVWFCSEKWLCKNGTFLLNSFAFYSLALQSHRKISGEGEREQVRGRFLLWHIQQNFYWVLISDTSAKPFTATLKAYFCQQNLDCLGWCVRRSRQSLTFWAVCILAVNKMRVHLMWVNESQYSWSPTKPFLKNPFLEQNHIFKGNCVYSAKPQQISQVQKHYEMCIDLFFIFSFSIWHCWTCYMWSHGDTVIVQVCCKRMLSTGLKMVQELRYHNNT